MVRIEAPLPTLIAAPPHSSPLLDGSQSCHLCAPDITINLGHYGEGTISPKNITPPFRFLFSRSHEASRGPHKEEEHRAGAFL